MTKIRCEKQYVMSKWHFNIRSLTFCIKWWLQLSKNVMFIISLIWLVVLFSFKNFRITCCLNINSKSSSDRLTVVTAVVQIQNWWSSILYVKGLYCKLLYLRVLTSKGVQTVHPMLFKYWNQNNQSPRIDLWSYLTSLLITMFNIVYIAIVNTKSIIDFGH